MTIFWPGFSERANLEDFRAAWGPSVARIPEATGLAAIRALAEEAKWPPSLAEFLNEARNQAGESPRTQSEEWYECFGQSAGCAFRVRGVVALGQHERACEKYAAVRRAAAEAAERERSTRGRG
jgi:hypothetical protein